MIDTHCHLNLEPLVQKADEYWRHANDQGITAAVVPSVDAVSSQMAVDLAQRLPGCHAAVGIHPSEAVQILTDGTDLESLWQQFEGWIRGKEAIAIGECGLDYFRLPESDLDQKHTKAAQKKLLGYQLDLAKTLDVPVILHVREAQADILEMLKHYQPKGVLHCFSGDKDYLEAGLSLGLYISLAGNITFKNAADLQALLPFIPQDKLLLETDAPYLNPVRGEFPNTPANVFQTYQFVAESLEKSLQDLAKQMEQNAAQLFRI